MAKPSCHLLLVFYIFVIGFQYSLTDEVLKEKDVKKVTEEQSVYAKICQKELNSTKEDVQDLTSKTKELSRGTKCLRACIGEKLKVVDDSGKLIKDAVIELFRSSLGKVIESSTKKIAEVIDKCNKEEAVKGDKCETVSKATECIVKELMTKSS